MRSLLLFAIFALAGTSPAYAQLVEDFSGGIPATWATFENGTGTVQDWAANATGCSSDGAAIRWENVASGVAIDYLVTPLVAIDAANPTMTFDRRESFNSNFGSVLTIEVSTTSQTDAATFTTVATFTELATAATTCITETVDLTAYAGMSIYVAFVWTNDDGDRLYIDNVNISPVCNNPVATFSTNDDCAGSSGFTIGIDITDLGGAASLTITDDQSTPSHTVTMTGPITYGSYPEGTDVVVTLTNTDEASCDLSSSTQTFHCPPANDECLAAVALVCNDPAISGTTQGATDNADDVGCGQGPSVWYSFVGTGLPVTLTLDPTFDAEIGIATGTCGAFVSVDCDDGSVGTETYTFTPDNGVTYFVTIGHFSTASTATGTFTLELTCESCANPTASYTITDDCANDQFSVAVEITDMGTATSLTISDDQAPATQTANMPDTYTFGPYAIGTSVVFTTTNDQDGSCSITSPAQMLVCPPANNLCPGAEGLTVNPDFNCGTVTPGTILGATASGEDEATCSGTENDDVWYSFVATATSHTISLNSVTGNTTDLYHSLWSGSCGALTNVLCSDPNSSTANGLLIGETYLLRVNSWGSTSGRTTTFDVCIGTEPPPPPVPANDLCADAEMLTVNADEACGTVTPGTIAGATASGEDEATCGGTENDDVWYFFMATATSHTIDLNNVVGNTTDLYHSVWSGSCGTLTNILCSDPNSSTATGLTVGVTYLLRVNSWGSTSGRTTTFDVCIGTPPPPPPPPANDACADAIALTDALGMPSAASGATYNTTSADPAETTAAEQCGSFTGNADDDIWFTVTAPNGAGDLITVMADGGPDLVITLFSGTCGSLVPVACSDGGNPEIITYVVPAGRSAVAETYYVQAFTYGTGGGEFIVSAMAALPVELISFSGQAMEKTNKLTWATAREDAADRYQVERSVNANSGWSVIGEVLAAGNSETEMHYELMDENPLANAYYRLRMVDQDGSFSFSDIVELANTTLGSSDLSVFPVPATNAVTVSFEAQAAGKAQIILTDLNGRTVSEQVMNVTTGQNTETIDLQRRAAGIYLVRVTVDGQQLVRRVIKR